jgi:hypothetical protein
MSMNGRRSAASTGGTSALRTAMSAATTNAAPVCSSPTPGTTAAATQIDAAATIHEISSRSGRSRGVAGCQLTCSPYGAAGVTGCSSAT